MESSLANQWTSFCDKSFNYLRRKRPLAFDKNMFMGKPFNCSLWGKLQFLWRKRPLLRQKMESSLANQWTSFCDKSFNFCGENIHLLLTKHVYGKTIQLLFVRKASVSLAKKTTFEAKDGQKHVFYTLTVRNWTASRICVSSLRRGHANLLCIFNPISVYVQLEADT